MSSTPVVTSDNHMYDDRWSSSSSSLNMSYENGLSSKQTGIQRRMNESVLEKRFTQLTNENEILRAKIEMLYRKFLNNKTPTAPDMDSSVSSTTEQISSLPFIQHSNLYNLLSDC